jgi:para-nitrobenzyl esterase
MHGFESHDDPMRFRPAKCWCVFAALALFCLLVLGGTAQAQVRTTQSGPVKGITISAVAEFRGIPYAAPPVGKLRWLAPEKPTAWTGTRNASAYGPACEQQLTAYPVSEDCLTLNIFAPANATAASKLPVMVWIHGGAFTSGSGRDFDGSALVRTGNVIVVTINYRLGYFGFLAHPALSAINPSKVSGNYGLLDQQASFAWVRRNIAAFGGNPKHITIFGESAGGQSVIDQLISPGAGPLSAAIAESGAYITNLPTLAQEETAGQATAKTLGCPGPGAACLYKLSASALNVLNPLTSLSSVSPNIDKVTIPMGPAQAFAAGKFQHIPVINGSNHDEYRLFVGLTRWSTHAPASTAQQYVSKVKGQFGPLAAKVLIQYPLKDFSQPDYAYAAAITDVAFACNAHLLSAQMARYTTVYEYELRDPNAPTASGPVVAGFSYGSAHSSDLSYLFPAYNVTAFHPAGPPPLTTAQQALRTKIQRFWTNLARGGNPVGPSTGAWNAVSKTSQPIKGLYPAADPSKDAFLADHRCPFWKPLLLSEAGLPANSAY